MYNLQPEISIGHPTITWDNYESIGQELNRLFNEGKNRIAIECYPGVNLEELEQHLFSQLPNVCCVKADDYAYDAETITKMIETNLTEDRVFGIMSHSVLEDYFPQYEINQWRHKTAKIEKILVYGIGATILLPDPDVLCYADLTRWEIQKRYRKGLANWKAANEHEDNLKKVKRGFFFEWRIADRLKQRLTDQIDYLIDTNVANQPKMVTGSGYRAALDEIVQQPFRLVP